MLSPFMQNCGEESAFIVSGVNCSYTEDSQLDPKEPLVATNGHMKGS